MVGVGVPKKNVKVVNAHANKVQITVVRHGERLDAANPRVWHSFSAAKKYPCDPPLTTLGEMQAEQVAEELADQGYTMVVSSPFVRCLCTAAKICQKLCAPLIIDAELGEVFGPCCFGDWPEPGPARRQKEEAVAFVSSDVELINGGEFVGAAPVWPETLQEGRLRMAVRVEEYVSRAFKLGGKSIVIVTHGDCVAACAAIAQSCARFDSGYHKVNRVNYCGYVNLAREFREGEEPGMVDKEGGWIVNHKGVLLEGWGLALPEEFSESAQASIQQEVEQLEKMTDNKRMMKQETIEHRSPRLLKRKTSMLLSDHYLKLMSSQDQHGCHFDDLLPNAHNSV